MSVDPEHLIELWTNSFKIPQWVDRKAYSNCKQCSKKFTRGKQHHCRLCGKMFCPLCTGKYHVPSIYKLKDKKGPTRVCYGCVEEALIIREKNNKDVLDERRIQLNLTCVRDMLFIHPPLQVLDPSNFYSCGLCGLKTNKTASNCSACGDVICDECLTSDVLVPKEFPKPPSTSTHKLCKNCRFITFNGAVFVETPPPFDATYAGIKSAAQEHARTQALERESSQRESESSFNATLQSNKTINSTKSSRSATKTASVRRRSLVTQNSLAFRQTLSKTLHTSSDNVLSIPAKENVLDSTTTPSSRGSVSDDITPLRIRWYGTLVDIAIVDVVLEETLLSLYNKLILSLPILKDIWICFTYNGLAIRPEHWELIPAKYFEPILHVKQGIFDCHQRTNTGKIGIAKHDFEMEEQKAENMLKLRKGDAIVVLKGEPDSGWWFGRNLSLQQSGWFPQDRIHILSESVSRPGSNSVSFQKI